MCWENDRKKVYYGSTFWRLHLHMEMMYLKKKSRVTDGHYQALRNPSEYEAALYGFLQLVLAIVYWSPDRCVTEIDLLTHNSIQIVSRDLDLVATKSRSRQQMIKTLCLGMSKDLSLNSLFAMIIGRNILR